MKVKGKCQIFSIWEESLRWWSLFLTSEEMWDERYRQTDGVTTRNRPICRAPGRASGKHWAVCCCSGLEVECVNNPALHREPARWLISRRFQCAHTHRKTFPFYKYADCQEPEIYNLTPKYKYNILLMVLPTLYSVLFFSTILWTHTS